MKTLYRTVSVVALTLAAALVTGNTASAQDAIVYSGGASSLGTLYSASNQSGSSTTLAVLEGGTLTLNGQTLPDLSSIGIPAGFHLTNNGYGATLTLTGALPLQASGLLLGANNGYGATLTLTGPFGQTGSVLTDSLGGTSTLNPSPIVVPSTKLPVLAGTVGGIQYKANAAGTRLHVKADVAISNTGTKAAKNVTATVYLSNDNKLDASDTKVLTLRLADYNNGVGTLGKGKTLGTKLKQSFPMPIAKGLQGKYLIVVLAADNVDPSAVPPIVVGPLNVP